MISHSRSERNSGIDDVLAAARRLTDRDKLRLIGRLAAELEGAGQPPGERSLLGALSAMGHAPSEEDIDQTRREMLASFPRDDIAQ